MSFDVDVVIRRGEAEVRCAFVAGEGATVLFGPSGVGKTSVLDMVAGLLRPDRGHVRVGGLTLFGDGVNVPPEKRGAGYVFQEPRLFPHMRVRANLLYGARGDTRLAAIAAMLDIAHLLDRWPRTLSGGEARRVAIGRALLSEPRVPAARRAACQPGRRASRRSDAGDRAGARRGGAADPARHPRPCGSGADRQPDRRDQSRSSALSRAASISPSPRPCCRRKVRIDAAVLGPRSPSAVPIDLSPLARSASCTARTSSASG